VIRLARPDLGEAEIRAVVAVLESGMLVQGARVAEFERQVAAAVGSTSAVAVSSGTAALHLSLSVLGVGAGDAVMLPAYSFTATANVVELCGARPVFVDIDERTFNIDSASLEEALHRWCAVGEAAPRVILPVHAFGLMADMRAITELSTNLGLSVVEDAACALGARRDGFTAGISGSLGCFSFHPRKAVTTGEGGAITTSDAALERRLRALRNHGQDPHAASPDFVVPGWNYRLSELQAAIGSVQMTRLQALIAAKQAAALYYNEMLAPFPVTRPYVPEGAVHVYQSYVILLPEEQASSRPNVIAQLRDAGIEASIGTWHIPMTRFYRERYGYRPGDFPITDGVFARSLSLPLYAGIPRAEQATVVEALAAVLSA